MAQSGYTPISLYYSATSGVAPTAGNLVNGELALNITDGKMYFKNTSGAVTLLASVAGAAAAGNLSGGTSGQIPYQNGVSSTVFMAAPSVSGTYLGWNGSGFYWTSSTGASGFSGFSGFSGYSGGTGTNGTSGYSGLSGYSGYSGSGVSGYSGSGISGYSGFSGYSGINGSSGSLGISGYSGFSGYSGSGASGYSGISGYSGQNGSAGASGFSGYSGSTSYTATNLSGGFVSATSIAYTTTLTGGTGIVNLGSGQFYKDASGNVSIGSTSTPATLYVKGGNSNNLSIDNGGQQYTTVSLYNNGTEKAQMYWDQTNTLFVFGTDVGAPVVFKAATVERMRISSAGGVSIGTSTDAGAGNLLVNGTINGTTITASTQFSGPGTGLTGTAAGLSIGGNAATATTAANGGVTSVNGSTGAVSLPAAVGVLGQVFTANGTFTVPAGVTAVKVSICSGGGGGGGGAFSGATSGGSGGSSSFGSYVVIGTSGGGAGSSNQSAGTHSGANGTSGSITGGTSYVLPSITGRGGNGVGGQNTTLICCGTTPCTNIGGVGGSSSTVGYVTGLTPGGSVTVTVGAAGTAGSPNGTAGVAGFVLIEW